MSALREMQRHAAKLCDENEITWHRSARNAWAIIESQEIFAPPIRGPVSYCVVMHELGHHLGRHNQSRHVMTRELWAWHWARANALLWTPTMERCAQSALAWYQPRAARIDRRRASWATVAEQLSEPH